MTRMLRSGVLAVALIAPAAAGYAQESARSSGARSPLLDRYIDQERGVSLADAIAQAIQREPNLRAARADIGIAQGMRLQAGARPNPTVSFEHRQEPAGMDNQTMAQLEWPLDLFR